MIKDKQVVDMIKELSNKLRKRQREYERSSLDTKDEKHCIRLNAMAQECALCNQDLIELITQ